MDARRQQLRQLYGFDFPDFRYLVFGVRLIALSRSNKFVVGAT